MDANETKWTQGPWSDAGNRVIDEDGSESITIWVASSTLTDSPAPHGRPVDPGIQNPGFAGLGLFALAVIGLIGYGVYERSR